MDTTFAPNSNPGLYDYVQSLAVQADGKILLGGAFATLCGQTRKNIARLNADATLDSDFNPGASDSVWSLALQSDGQILAGGNFTNLCGQARNYIGRLNNTIPAKESLAFDRASIIWLRERSAPEISQATAEVMIPGTAWSSLGSGTRIAGGWRWTGLALPSGCYIRVRGTVTGGRENGSAWFIEKTAQAPVVASIDLPTPILLGHTLSLGLSTQTGLRYTLQYKERLDQPTWVDLPGVSGTGDILGISDTNATSAQRYYRLKITPE